MIISYYVRYGAKIRKDDHGSCILQSSKEHQKPGQDVSVICKGRSE
jgi:hypothetical protein